MTDIKEHTDETKLLGKRYNTTDIKCPRCNKGKLIYMDIMFCFTPIEVSCTECDLKESFYTFMGKELVKVEKLPEAAIAKYEKYQTKVETYQKSKDQVQQET